MSWCCGVKDDGDEGVLYAVYRLLLPVKSVVTSLL
jgi:hypothetical protein